MPVRESDPLEPLDFGIDVDGAEPHTLLVLDVTPGQLEKIHGGELSLPAGWRWTERSPSNRGRHELLSAGLVGADTAPSIRSLSCSAEWARMRATNSIILQMVTEKLGKAYFWRIARPPRTTHASFVRFIQALGDRRTPGIDRIAELLGFGRPRELENWIRKVTPLAYDLERLAPDLAGVNNPNAEYPWPHARRSTRRCHIGSRSGRRLLRRCEAADCCRSSTRLSASSRDTGNAARFGQTTFQERRAAGVEVAGVSPPNIVPGAFRIRIPNPSPLTPAGSSARDRARRRAAPRRGSSVRGQAGGSSCRWKASLAKAAARS